MRLLAIAGLVLAAGAARAQVPCPTGTFRCGTQHCTPNGQVCCASVGREEVSCPAGNTCLTDGTCMVAGMCGAPAMPTLSGCGGDTCGCSAACAKHDDCESDCCTTANLCAPACVCSGSGLLFVNCDTQAVGHGGLTPKGCGMAPGARSVAALLPLLLGIALARLRGSCRAGCR